MARSLYRRIFYLTLAGVDKWICQHVHLAHCFAAIKMNFSKSSCISPVIVNVISKEPAVRLQQKGCGQHEISARMET